MGVCVLYFLLLSLKSFLGENMVENFIGRNWLTNLLTSFEFPPLTPGLLDRRCLFCKLLSAVLYLKGQESQNDYSVSSLFNPSSDSLFVDPRLLGRLPSITILILDWAWVHLIGLVSRDEC